MASTEIKSGDVEPLARWYFLNYALVTGVTVTVSISRSSDGLKFDFADNTFKVSPGTPTRNLTESPSGYYATTFDTSTIANPTSPDSYIVTYKDATNNRTLDEDEVRVRAINGLPAAIANLDISALTNAKLLGGALTRLRKWLTWTSATPNKKRVNASTQKFEVYDDDGTTLLDNPAVADANGNNVTPQTGELSRIG